MSPCQHGNPFLGCLECQEADSARGDQWMQSFLSPEVVSAPEILDVPDVPLIPPNTRACAWCGNTLHDGAIIGGVCMSPEGLDHDGDQVHLYFCNYSEMRSHLHHSHSELISRVQDACIVGCGALAKVWCAHCRKLACPPCSRSHQHPCWSAGLFK